MQLVAQPKRAGQSAFDDCRQLGLSEEKAAAAVNENFYLPNG
jgi:hypothetical protein